MSKNAAMLQVEVHPNFRNDRTIDWCKQEGIHVTAYAPLSSPQTMSSQKKSVPNLLEVSHLCRPPARGHAGLCCALPVLQDPRQQSCMLSNFVRFLTLLGMQLG